MEALMSLFSGHDFGFVGTLFIGILLFVYLLYKKIDVRFSGKVSKSEFDLYVATHMNYHGDFHSAMEKNIDKIFLKLDQMDANLLKNSETIHQLIGQMMNKK